MWCVYKLCSECFQPCNKKNRDIYWTRYKETLYIGQWYLSPLKSRHLGTSHSSPNCHQLPHGNFSESHWWSEVSSLSKVILDFGKARSHRAPNLGCGGAELPGWFAVSPKKLCMRRDAWASVLLWWPHSTRAHPMCLLPPLTSTVKLSLFTVVHSSPFSLAARLHPCCSNCSHILTMAGVFRDRPCIVLTTEHQNTWGKRW